MQNEFPNGRTRKMIYCFIFLVLFFLIKFLMAQTCLKYLNAIGARETFDKKFSYTLSNQRWFLHQYNITKF